jgi:hypothetical protein
MTGSTCSLEVNMNNARIRANWPTYAIVAGVTLFVWSFTGYTGSQTVSVHRIDEPTGSRTIPGGFSSEARFEMAAGALLATIGFANRKSIK